MNYVKNIARSCDELISFLVKTLESASFEIAQTDFANQSEWELNNGIISHVTRGYFHIVGVKNLFNINEEYLMLYQPQGAFNGLIIYKSGKVIYVLLQARVEPGNSNVIQYGPTIQSTPANYMRLHGGKETPYLNLFHGFDPAAKPLIANTQLDLGERYFQKIKTLSYVQTGELIDTGKNMIWAPIANVFELIGQDYLTNTDLKSMLSVFNWDSMCLSNPNENGSLTENDKLLLNELYNPFRRKEPKAFHLMPINDLKSWQLNENGAIDVANKGYSVSLFSVHSKTREVESWIQPLVCCNGNGLVQLLVRKSRSGYEFLVTLDSEPGLTTDLAILPSYLYYPGSFREAEDLHCKEGEVLVEELQSDEGGRFYLNNGRFQIIQVENNYKGNRNQYWISHNLFKQLLNSSCICTIQLRCIASLVLNLLNPNTFVNE